MTETIFQYLIDTKNILCKESTSIETKKAAMKILYTLSLDVNVFEQLNQNDMKELFSYLIPTQYNMIKDADILLYSLRIGINITAIKDTQKLLNILSLWIDHLVHVFENNELDTIQNMTISHYSSYMHLLANLTSISTENQILSWWIDYCNSHFNNIQVIDDSIINNLFIPLHGVFSINCDRQTILHCCSLLTNMFSTEKGRVLLFQESNNEIFINGLFDWLDKCIYNHHDSCILLYERMLHCVRNCAYAASELDNILDSKRCNIFFVKSLMTPLVSACSDHVIHFKQHEIDEYELFYTLNDIETIFRHRLFKLHHHLVDISLETLDTMRISRTGRFLLRKWKIYPILREFHLAIANEIQKWDLTICNLVQCIFDDKELE